MSKNEALMTIETTDLTTVCGGLEVKGKGSVEIGPGTGKIEGEVEYKRSSYESCLAVVTSRKDWTPEEVKNTCGLPPS